MEVTSEGARELAQLLTIRHKFVYFDVTSPVEIDCARSSLCLAHYCGRRCSATHRVLKSQRYFNMYTLNALIRHGTFFQNLVKKLSPKVFYDKFLL